MIKIILLLLIFNSALVSCGLKKKHKKTSTTFKIFTGALSDPNLSGGVMVYGQSDLGDKLALNVTSDTVSLPVPNGLWTFYGFGWDGTTPLTGALRCGEAEADLKGADTPVKLNISSANCTSDNYGPIIHKNSNQFKPLRLIHCDSIASIVDGNSNCSGILSATKSYQVSFNTFGENASPPLTATCINDASNIGGDTTTILNIPTGGILTQFLSMSIKTFKNVNCTNLSSDILFPNGLGLAGNKSIMHSHVTNNVLFLKAPASITVTGISLSPMGARPLVDSTSASFKMKHIATALVTQTVQSSSTSFKFNQGRKAQTSKPRFSQSTNFKIHIGNQ